MKKDHILLGHGSGGKLSHDLINELFIKHFASKELMIQSDSAILKVASEYIAVSTDSFVVDPIFFPGGNIGKLAIAGTVNDLAVSGAIPKYLTCGFILEEGLKLSELEEIVITMAEEAQKAGVIIVSGDTKVVDKGKCDKIFINTTGIGQIEAKYKEISTASLIQPGDKILINGTIGDHGMAIMAERNDLNISSDIQSDCACLNGMIKDVMDVCADVRFMRDATRGGLATVMAEIVESNHFGVELFEENIPVNENVRGICELLGFDPLYVANEGKVVMVVPEKDATQVVETMQQHPFGKQASIIGNITSDHPGKGWMHTSIGGKRVIDMLSGEQLPRIC